MIAGWAATKQIGCHSADTTLTGSHQLQQKLLLLSYNQQLVKKHSFGVKYRYKKVGNGNNLIECKTLIC